MEKITVVRQSENKARECVVEVHTHDSDASISRKYAINGVDDDKVPSMTALVRALFTGKSIAVANASLTTNNPCSALRSGLINVKEAKKLLQACGSNATYTVRLATFGINTGVGVNNLTYADSLKKLSEMVGKSSVPCNSRFPSMLDEGTTGSVSGIEVGIDLNGLVVLYGNMDSKVLEYIVETYGHLQYVVAVADFMAKSVPDKEYRKTNQLMDISKVYIDPILDDSEYFEMGQLELSRVFEDFNEFKKYVSFPSAEFIRRHIGFSRFAHKFELIEETAATRKKIGAIDEMLEAVKESGIPLNKDVLHPHKLTLSLNPESKSVLFGVKGVWMGSDSISIQQAYGSDLEFVLRHTFNVLENVSFEPFANDIALQPVANIFNAHFKKIMKGLICKVAVYLSESESTLASEGMVSSFAVPEEDVCLAEDGVVSYTLKDEYIKLSIVQCNEISKYLN